MEFELRLILLVGGLVVIGLIYAWGVRSRIKSGLSSRRRRRVQHTLDDEPLGEESATPDNSISTSSGVKVLEDVEIRVIDRTEEALQRRKQAMAETDSADAAIATPAESFVASDIDKSATEVPDTTLSSEDEIAKLAPEQRSKVRSMEKPEMTVLMSMVAPRERPFAGPDVQRVAAELALPLGKTGVWECNTEVDNAAKTVFSIGHLREPGTFDLATIERLQTPGLLMFMKLPGPLEAVSAVDLMMAMAGQLAEKLGGTVCDSKNKKMTPQTMIQLRTEADAFERRWQAYRQANPEE